jgi:hypothetical protein
MRLEKTLFADLTEAGHQRLYLYAERAIQFSLITYALFAPHSIAITQGSYLLGALAWAVQLILTRRLNQMRTPADVALFGFFACCVASSFLSYDPLLSIKGLRSPAFFLAFYFVSSRVRSLRFARFLSFALIGSCLINVAYSAAQFAKGRGVRIDSIRADSELKEANLMVGDCIIEADGQPVNTVEDLSRIIDSRRGRLSIKFERKEAIYETSVSRRALRGSSGTGVERLGITASPGRNFRVTGFYNHYETYAEVLQLIASLCIGMLIAHPRKRSPAAIFLAVSAPLILAALVLTSTRAAMLGLAASMASMAIASSRRRAITFTILVIVILAPVMFFTVERFRGISFFDTNEGSTAYRLEVWREALSLIRDNPLVGIGKGSESNSELKEKYGLFDSGKLPPGHFHSTIIQIATWWGLPALSFYLAFMTIFIVESWKLCRRAREEKHWDSMGIALGVMGAIVAFNVSSLVHFNFGDGEVVMAFWLFAGIAFAIRRLELEAHFDLKAKHKLAAPLECRSYKSQSQGQETTFESSDQVATAKQN